jgi:hypothetical protein
MSVPFAACSLQAWVRDRDDVTRGMPHAARRAAGGRP